MYLEQQLAELLGSETRSLQKLLGILGQEKEALTSANVEAIEKATTAKNQALAIQADITQARRNLVLGSSFSDNAEGLRQLILTCNNEEDLLATFKQLTALAVQCRDTNRLNGRLILQQQQQTRGALDILRQSGQRVPTYSGQGKTTAEQSTRTLGKA